MNLKEFLEKNPIINKSQLSQEMWVGNKSPKSKLYNKLSENTVGSGKQRITEKDEEDAKRVLEQLVHKIVKYISS